MTPPGVTSPLPRVARQSVRAVRKVGLLGSHGASLKWCPWSDPSWELWGHASARHCYRREPDLYFDLHRRECRTERPRASTYVKWLAKNTVPIMMQEHDPAVPASLRYPREQILLEYGGIRRYFKNHLAWMIALAFARDVTHIGLWGINYGHDTEYAIQRGSAEYWLGRAEERGIHLMLPDACTLLAEPAGLYGYESHDERGARLPQYSERKPKPEDTIKPLVPGEPRPVMVEPPPDVLAAIAEEEAQHPRPDWARGNGGIQKEA